MTHADGDWTALDDLVALHTASDVHELHRRLVLYPTAPTNASDAFEPWCLFHHFHRDDPEGAVTTAVLIVTDRRWRNATGRLIRQIDESALISPDDLDILAQTFLAAGPHVYWEVPGEWFGGPAIPIDLESHPDGGDDDDEEPDDRTAEGPVVVARDIRPPLRRWASERLVRADPGRWGRLLTRAREVDPRGGAAIVRGVLDGIDGLMPAARASVIKLATTWPQRDVREAAAELITGRAPDKASPPMPAPGRDPGLRSTAQPTSRRDAAQPSLF
jgi:hypothetical protein